MLVKTLELENIKSYEAARYEFDEGIIAIIGENGSGKTTIIEAIAWALFDVLEYKKEDFIRRGQKRGVVRVTFVSPTDGREYVVQRDTANQYEVYDPQNKIRIAQGKSEVMSFIHKALGVGSVDLQVFFRCAIGVPQGTFTADFLRTPSERKVTFDKLLKVEEYKQASEALLLTQRYGEQQRSEVVKRILRMEGEIEHLQDYEEKIKSIGNEIQKLSDELEKLEAEIKQKSELVEKLDEQEKKFVEMENALRSLREEKRKNESLLNQKQRELEEAKEAVEKVSEVKEDYLRHREITELLGELDKKRNQRSKLLEKRNNAEIQISKLSSDLEKLKENLQKVEEAKAKIGDLKSFVPKQEELEKRLEEAQSLVHREKSLQEQVKNLEEKIKKLRREYENKNKQRQELEKELKDDIEKYDSLNARLDELNKQITYLQAKWEAEKKFRQEIKGGLCPILNQKCLNIREGETLENVVAKKVSDSYSEIEVLETEKKSVETKLQAFQEIEKKKLKLESLKTEIGKMVQDGKSLRKEQDELKTELEKIGARSFDFSKIKEELESLGHPKTQIRLLEEEIKKETELRKKISHAEKQVSQLYAEVENIKTQIDSLGDVESEWQRLSKEKEKTLTSYEQYLKYEKAANAFPKIQQEYEELRKNLEDLATRLSEQETEFEAVCKVYSRGQHEAEKQALQRMKIEQATKRTTLENLRKDFENCLRQIEKLREVREKIQKEESEKQRLDKVLEAVQFTRETLKVSGPLVVKNLIEQISNEANRIFREIMDNHEITLEWTEDYSIVLEEKGYKRPFASLSGGEQMAAALAVRLAFLLLLSDIRIAFFDEPTTNMDGIRCERLAQQIERINNSRYFNQLFIISHDSTFGSLVDNPIYVQKKQ
ncbi:MAG: hypothetical protein D6687_02200 [Acidobacteria bacterium]|nr:MAG: hypothetical protein D6687_02200 [Acidobacteriota bacterium]